MRLQCQKLSAKMISVILELLGLIKKSVYIYIYIYIYTHTYTHTQYIKGFVYLYPGFREVDFQCDFLTHENIWVSSFTKERLQDVQLRAGERSPLSPLLPCRC